jgi:MFS family permease
MIILLLKAKLGETEFAAWGWRIPFLLSSVLVIFSYLVRRKMAESPAFAALQAEGGLSKNPLVESFVNPVNRKLVLVALFGVVAGQGVVWYTAQFYVNLFMTQTLHINAGSADKIVAWALVFATPFFVLFGALSDRIGRKKIIMAGIALSILAYIPIYGKMQSVATVDTIGGSTTQHLTHAKDSKGEMHTFHVVAITDDAKNTEQTTYHDDPSLPHFKLRPGEEKEVPKVEVFLSAPTFWTLVGLVFLQVFFVTMAYGPIAAFLVEMFPVQIRYTSMSVPYHIGNGVFGGLVPVVALWLVTRTQNDLAGLLYPIGVGVVTLLVGSYFVHEKTVDDGVFVEEA